MRPGLHGDLEVTLLGLPFHYSLESALMSFLKKQSVRTRILASLTALVLTTGLAGCSDDDDADLEDTANASDVETEYVPASADGPAQNVPEPSLPAVATENSEEGAEATLQYFWEAVDYARLTGETDPLALVSHESCEFCDDYIEGWQDRYRDGDWAVIHEPIEIDILESNTHFDEQQQDEWTAISYDITQPAADLYVDGEILTEESVEEVNSATWIADLSYDGTSQRWLLEWTGQHEEDDVTG